MRVKGSCLVFVTVGLGALKKEKKKNLASKNTSLLNGRAAQAIHEGSYGLFAVHKRTEEVETPWALRGSLRRGGVEESPF